MELLKDHSNFNRIIIWVAWASYDTAVGYLKMTLSGTTRVDLSDGLTENTRTTEILLDLSKMYAVCNAVHYEFRNTDHSLLICSYYYNSLQNFTVNENTQRCSVNVTNLYVTDYCYQSYNVSVEQVLVTD